MGNIDDIVIGPKLPGNESQILRIICRVFASITNILVLTSIIIFLINFCKLKLNQIIQLKMCISIFIYEASHYFPNFTTQNWECYLQCILGYGFQIMMAYYTTIYSYVAMILFIKPLSITNYFNTFIIFFSDYILLGIIIVFILYGNPKMTIYYNFLVQTTDMYGRLFNYGLIFLFSILGIINIIRLIINIENSLMKNMDITFVKDKLNFCKKTLKKYVLGTLFIFHCPILILLLFGSKILTKDIFINFYFCLYVFINKSLMGLIYWLVFVFSKNLWYKFLMLIRKENSFENYKEFKNEDGKFEFNELKNIANLKIAKGVSLEELEKSSAFSGSLLQNFGEDEEM